MTDPAWLGKGNFFDFPGRLKHPSDAGDPPEAMEAVEAVDAMEAMARTIDFEVAAGARAALGAEL